MNDKKKKDLRNKEERAKSVQWRITAVDCVVIVLNESFVRSFLSFQFDSMTRLTEFELVQGQFHYESNATAQTTSQH
jgi:hypothetical protein